MALVSQYNHSEIKPLAASPVKAVVKEKPKSSLDATMNRIAMCESRNNPNAKNPNSSASGRFQFLTGTWKHYGLQKWGTLEGRSVFDYGDNTELAYWVVRTYGTRDWNASKHCWQ